MSRVLLVEDDAALAAAVIANLEAGGDDVVAARNLDAAYEALSGDAFDVVLCDDELPVYPGGRNDGRGTTLLGDLAAEAERPVLILWSGVDRSREIAAEMTSPPDHFYTKDRLGEVLDLIAGLR